MEKNKLELHTKEVQNIIYTYAPAEEGFQKTIFTAMNYSFQAGGKRLRPLLMQETYRLFGGTGKVVEPFMAAIEMIHTYSLMICRHWIMMNTAEEERLHMWYLVRQWRSLLVMRF